MVKKEEKTVKTRKNFVDMLVFEIFRFCHTPVTQCLCVLDPVPELGQSELITDGQGSSQGALASDQHDVPSHPHTDPKILLLWQSRQPNI